jgi:DNA-3-methyladenine glycosylase I
MTEADIERLLQDPGIIRHRGKIVSTINNANRAIELQNEFGSLAAYIWRFEPDEMAAPEKRGGIESETEASRALSKDLRKRGWTFVGPTTVYAFMQAMGLVNVHYSRCFARAECAHERKTLKRPG